MKIPVNEKRVKWIDLVKVIAIIIVLMNHIGLAIPGLNAAGGLFYVPVFFVLAGFTYHRKEESFKRYLKRKAKRLLVPYFGYSAFLFLFYFLKEFITTGSITGQMFFPVLGAIYGRNSLFHLGTASNISFLTIWNAPMWFLPALFLTSVLMELVLRMGCKSCKNIGLLTSVLVFVGIMLHYLCKLLLPWSLDSAFLFLLYMVAGYAMAEHNWLELFRKRLWIPVLLLALCMIGYLVNGSANISVGEFGSSVLFGLFIGVAASYLIMFVCYMIDRWIPRGICVVGEKTIQILCLHLWVFMFFLTGANAIAPQLLGLGVAGMIYKTLMILITMGVITAVSYQIDEVRDRRSQR